MEKPIVRKLRLVTSHREQPSSDRRAGALSIVFEGRNHLLEEVEAFRRSHEVDLDTATTAVAERFLHSDPYLLRNPTWVTVLAGGEELRDLVREQPSARLGLIRTPLKRLLMPIGGHGADLRALARSQAFHRFYGTVWSSFFAHAFAPTANLADLPVLVFWTQMLHAAKLLGGHGDRDITLGDLICLRPTLPAEFFDHSPRKP